MQLEDAIKNRKSVKKYSSKKPDWRKVIQAIDYARYVPMAGNQNVTRFIMIQDTDKIKKLASASSQNFIQEAQIVVAVISDGSTLNKHFDEFGEKYARQQSGAMIQNFLLALTEKKLATTWVGWYNEEKIKKILEVPEEMTVEAIFPIGIETEATKNDKPKRKPDLEGFIYFDSWENKEMTPPTRVREING